MLQITDTLFIDEKNLEERFVRASGPGGQNVNKVSTAVELRFNVDASDLPFDVKERLLKLLVFLKKEGELSELQKKLASEVDQRVNKFQREFFLREQLKSIKKELGLEEDDKSRESKALRGKLAKAQVPPHVEKVAKEELNRLQTIPEMSPEFNLARTYIDWLVTLPWSKRTDEVIDLVKTQQVLDAYEQVARR